ncbi:uncharacterized protein LOC142351642 [Convolutriloba macropyga]|uniref:uncharacterized protein LOC142351642 n=1 Tax=Convolutriloba macropyga TaxID=536237 RepID=UPI003F51D815
MMRDLLISKDEEKHRSVDQERNKYEEIIKNVTEGYEKDLQQMQLKLSTTSSENEAKVAMLEDQLVAKEEELKEAVARSECVRVELEEKLMNEKVQMESELQAQIAGLQYQLDLKHQQQQNKAAAFSWNASQEQMHRKKLANMKAEHEKQVRALQMKIKEIEAKLRRCKCQVNGQGRLGITSASANNNSFSSPQVASDQQLKF